MDNSRSDESALDPYFTTDLHLAYDFRNLHGIKNLRLGFSVYNLFNEDYFNNGYSYAGYYVAENGEKVIYRGAGYAAQAPTHVMGTVTLSF